MAGILHLRLSLRKALIGPSGAPKANKGLNNNARPVAGE